MTESDNGLPARCAGCGVALQTVDEDKPGYVPAGALQRDNPVCRRCFRIRHYGEFSRVVVPADVYRREVAQIAARPGLVLYVLDIFDLPGSLVPDLHELIGQSPVIALVNKVDVLPNEVRVAAMHDWILKQLQASGITPAQVLFVSAANRSGLDAVLDVVAGSSFDRVYVVGMANVGKSTLLNQLLRATGRGAAVTASRVPGTTVGLVEIPCELSGGRIVRLVDTPGLLNMTRATDALCPACLKVAVPQDPIRPRVYQLNPQQSLWLGGFARFDFRAGPHQPVVCYVSNGLVVHRTKLENAEGFGRDHADDILLVPCAECRNALGDFRRLRVTTREVAFPAEEPVLPVQRQGIDIVLSGLGWITLMGRPFDGTLHVRESISVSVRPRLVGHVSRRQDGIRHWHRT